MRKVRENSNSREKTKKVIMNFLTTLLACGAVTGCGKQYRQVPSHIPQYQTPNLPKSFEIHWDGNIKSIVNAIQRTQLVEPGQFRMPEVDKTLGEVIDTFKDSDRVVRYCLDEASEERQCSANYTIDWPEEYKIFGAKLDESDDWNWQPLLYKLVRTCNNFVNICLKEVLKNPELINQTQKTSKRIPKETTLPPLAPQQPINYKYFSEIDTLNVIFTTNDALRKKGEAFVTGCLDTAVTTLPLDTQTLIAQKRKDTSNHTFWAYPTMTKDGYSTYLLRKDKPRKSGESVDEDMFDLKERYLSCLNKK